MAKRDAGCGLQSIFAMGAESVWRAKSALLYREFDNVVDSPEVGTFSEPAGRALTARIRLVGMK